MSLFKKLVEKLAGESGELKKIRMEAEKRRSGKSSGAMPKVDDDVIDKTIEQLETRIDSGSDYKKPKK